mgnify:CR=1 FL=1
MRGESNDEKSRIHPSHPASLGHWARQLGLHSITLTYPLDHSTSPPSLAPVYIKHHVVRSCRPPLPDGRSIPPHLYVDPPSAARRLSVGTNWDSSLGSRSRFRLVDAVGKYVEVVLILQLELLRCALRLCEGTRPSRRTRREDTSTFPVDVSCRRIARGGPGRTEC